MVNKIAVMAVVALVAIPIGLGYALNFQDVETTRYEAGKTTNVTQLLQNETTFDYVQANSYQLNGAQFTPYTREISNYASTLMYPFYNTYSTTASSLRMIHDAFSGDLTLINEMSFLFFNLNLDITAYTPGREVNTVAFTAPPGMIVYPSVYNTITAYNVLSLTLDPSTLETVTVEGSTYVIADWNVVTVSSSGKVQGSTTFKNVHTFTIDNIADVPIYRTFARPGTDVRDRYPVISDGFHLESNIQNTGLATWISPGGAAKNILLTMDLSTVSGSMSILSTYESAVETETCNAIPIVNTSDTHSIAGQDVIYNDGQPNIYQIYIQDSRAIIHYCGSTWPSAFGEANYYREWAVPYEDIPNVYYAYWSSTFDPYPGLVPVYNADANDYIRMLRFVYTSLSESDATTYQPISIGKMRIDAALTRSAPYPVIVDNEYNPARITGSNQSTTSITDVARYGDSISFGGNTYTLTKGNITMPSGRQLPLSRCTFESVYNADTQQYDNRIGGTVISTSATPSTITFNGTWDANVTSAPITSETTTVQKWIAGGWAWDGVGVSFGMVGLVACVGVFIALGMYGRRSGAKVGALMLVCAGGALIFLSLL